MLSNAYLAVSAKTEEFSAVPVQRVFGGLASLAASAARLLVYLLSLRVFSKAFYSVCQG